MFENSLKLVEELRSRSPECLCELRLEEPIRYSVGDPLEAWLNDVLCLDNEEGVSSGTPASMPHPSECTLRAVHLPHLLTKRSAEAEHLLRALWKVFTDSHYRNSPNDLQLLADAAAHSLLVLLAPLQAPGPPQALCVLQVALEGGVSAPAVSPISSPR